MNEIAIRVEHLSKRYRIGQYVGSGAQYKTLRESLTDVVSAPLRRLKYISKFEFRNSKSGGSDSQSAIRTPQSNRFLWALKDISFEVKQGEVLGIIGRNGAGKSTLLKVLTRITEPTEGQAELHGRVGSLLEVGTGFHPELTGRENIYLSGAILGMMRKEIDRKFDEIVDFSGIEKFIDTPVKRYSSGMTVRLGFAVAAHLEPEILLIDEVLAVGDYEFQKKCLGKMKDVSEGGKTVLLVSHNIPSITNLCSRAILLVQGKVDADGPARDVVDRYIAAARSTGGECVWSDACTAPGNENVRLHAVRVVSDGEVTADVDIQKDIVIEIDYWNFEAGARLDVGIHLKDRMNTYVLASANRPSASIGIDPWSGRSHPVGLFRTRCRIPDNFLNEGQYSVDVAVNNHTLVWQAGQENAVSFVVHDSGAMRKEYQGRWVGVVRPRLAWATEYLGSGNISTGPELAGADKVQS